MVYSCRFGGLYFWNIVLYEDSDSDCDSTRSVLDWWLTNCIFYIMRIKTPLKIENYIIIQANFGYSP